METFAVTLYALPVYQCIVLAVLLFAGNRQRKGHSNLIMGFFQLLLAFYFSFNLLYKIKAFVLIADIYFLILPVIISFIPVFYLYILSITTPEFRFNKTHLIHFIPAFLILVLNSPYLFFSHHDKLTYLTRGYNFTEIQNSIRYLLYIYVIGIYGICNLQLIYYLFCTIRVYKRHKQYIVDHYSYTENINLNWILALILVFISFFILNNILYIIGFKQHLLSQVFYVTSMLGVTMFAGIQGLRQKELDKKILYEKSVLQEQITTRKDREIKDDQTGQPAIIPEQGNAISGIIKPDIEYPVVESENDTASEKYSGSALSDVQKQIIVNKLETLMEVEKIYIIDTLSVEHVAERLGTNTKYISQVINEHYKKNFYNFINTYRIEEAKRLLQQSDNHKYSILGIAHMVGFVSKSTFNTAFKRYTGGTPSEFKAGIVKG